jgi:hypothetical protein
MSTAFGSRTHRAVQKNLARHHLSVCEEEVQSLWAAAIVGRDILEIDRLMVGLREAIIRFISRRAELERADKDLQEVETDIQVLEEIIKARGPRTTPQYDDTSSSLSYSGCSSEVIEAAKQYT